MSENLTNLKKKIKLDLENHFLQKLTHPQNQLLHPEEVVALEEKTRKISQNPHLPPRENFPRAASTNLNPNEKTMLLVLKAKSPAMRVIVDMDRVMVPQNKSVVIHQLPLNLRQELLRKLFVSRRL